MSSVVVYIDDPTPEVTVPRQPKSLDTDIAGLVTNPNTALHAAIASVSGTKADAVADSAATTVAGLVTDVNNLLAELRAAGVIASE